MKILVVGSDGFVGRNVADLLSQEHEVLRANRKPAEKELFVDLLDLESITKVIKQSEPETVINCAGVVDNSEAASQNPIFTKNLLNQIVLSSLKPKRVIISGSAAEYGIVDPSNIPVAETAPLNATSGYGLSKLQEEEAALEIGENSGIDVVVARIFNPIGAGMHPRFLIPKLISQLDEYNQGERNSIEVSRLDSKRDYVNIKDISAAIKCLVENNPKERVYNIGSGNSTSNAELIDLVIKLSNATKRPKIIETATEPESLVAIQADITRLSDEFGWTPIHGIEETIKEIIHATGK
jgi:nucleoside-diphosphate-sugar epimerase